MDDVTQEAIEVLTGRLSSALSTPLGNEVSSVVNKGAKKQHEQLTQLLDHAQKNSLFVASAEEELERLAKTITRHGESHAKSDKTVQEVCRQVKALHDDVTALNGTSERLTQTMENIRKQLEDIGSAAELRGATLEKALTQCVDQQAELTKVQEGLAERLQSLGESQNSIHEQLVRQGRLSVVHLVVLAVMLVAAVCGLLFL